MLIIKIIISIIWLIPLIGIFIMGLREMKPRINDNICDLWHNEN